MDLEVRGGHLRPCTEDRLAEVRGVDGQVAAYGILLERLTLRADRGRLPDLARVEIAWRAAWLDPDGLESDRT